MKENLDVWMLWRHVKTQWRAGPLGLIGLDYQEIRIGAKELDIDLSPCLWKKIKILENFELGRSPDAN